MVSCANYMDQQAIDAVIRKENADMRQLNLATGVKDDPVDLYTEGTCCCQECADGGHPDDVITAMMRNAGADKFHRLCYKPKEPKDFNVGVYLDNQENS